MTQTDTRRAAATQAAPTAAAPFPVVWEHPDDARGFWQQDRMHFPEPTTRLDHDFVRVLYEHGFNTAAARYQLPIRAAARRINAYHYSAMAPNIPPEQMEEQGKLAEAEVTPIIDQLGDLWEQEWLPELKQYLATWRAYDLAGADAPQLLAHLEWTLERLHRIWEIHFLIAFPMLLSISMFDDFYRDLFGDEDAFQAYRLLQGFDNKTLESNRELWGLSRKAVAAPEVRAAFETLPIQEVIPALEQSAAGQEFLGHLHTFLSEYGRRGDSWGLRRPGWIEDPSSVLRNLKDYVQQPDRDLGSERAALIEERERVLAETRQRLQGYPRQVVGQFEGLLKAAQVANVLSEEHGFWIDFSTTYEVRLVILELGRRFAATGVIDHADDIFVLSLDEIRATASELPGLDRRALVAERKAELEAAAKVTAPPVLGTPPAGPPPQDPIGRAIVKMFGGGPPPASEVPSELRGSAGSPGTVTGPARVVRSLDEADRVRPGDVLIAEFTAPPWTPLFATVAAVVTDAGGILSHCAVVAREYGIPAVVGTGRATATIKDGQLVEVDGNAGIVRLLDA
ncbi:MAG: PEP-utilizing enzyme [Chloroflexota bacterium]